MRRLSVVVLLIALASICLAEEEEAVPLTRNILTEKYGQEDTEFNDGKSCNRECTGDPKTCYYEFNVQMYDSMSGLCGNCEYGNTTECFNKGCVTANGVQRSIMTINKLLPGPTINVCKNDRIIIDVTNHMNGQEFSLHWHGLQQKGSQWSDGVPMVTQCPIFAGNSFRYIYTVPDAGTHLYHAHSGLHRSNGIHGKLIIREANDTAAIFYDYDLHEHSIIVADWNNFLAEEKAPGTRNETLLPESLLINGYGQHIDADNGTIKHAPIEAFYVERGKKHRFRTVNAGSHNCPLEYSIKNHNLTVIAVDGNQVEPIVVQKIVFSPGERFDVVIDVPNDPNINETLFTVRGLLSCNRRKLQEFARIVYVNDIKNLESKVEHHEPLVEKPSYESLNITAVTLNYPLADCVTPGNYCIAALQHRDVPSSVGGNLRNETAIVVPFTFRLFAGVDRPFSYKTFGPFALVGSINNITNEPSPVPGLIQDDSEVQYCNMNKLPDHCNAKSVCHCRHLVQLELCKVYEFLLIDGRKPDGLVNHPIHLHGFRYQVIDMGTKEQYETGTSAFRNATHLPVIRDTTIIPQGGFVRFRFRSCNPGYWFFHCHFEYHTHSGMTATIKVGNRSDFGLPSFKFPTCGNSLAPVFD